MKKLEELGISPAPWSADMSIEDDAWVEDARGNDILRLAKYERKNASLIAAAPKLYDAAERMLRFHGESCVIGERTYDEITRDYKQAVSDLRDALAEAAGEQLPVW